MSRFYGTLNAGRSTATKCGHAKDGLSASARGWDVGADLWIHAAANNPELDLIEIEATAGSNGAWSRLHLATLHRDGDGYKITGGRVADLIDAARAMLGAIEFRIDDPRAGMRDKLGAALRALGVD